TSPENQMYYASIVSSVFTLNKPAVWLGYSLDGQDKVSVTGNIVLIGLLSGLHNNTLYTKDEFENIVGSEIIYFTTEEPPNDNCCNFCRISDYC
ncbi:MAG: hypothetical protein R3319_05720, partial [Candidatus Bathyarchaeia archaeon]|nr:hypothetical protein [Candidatus Bathyarchaeia archaeon]